MLLAFGLNILLPVMLLIFLLEFHIFVASNCWPYKIIEQIQAAIAQTFRRQTEALSRKRRRSQGNYRRRRNYRSEDDDDANGHDGGKDSSSADERGTEPKPKRPKRWRGQPSPAAASAEGGVEENDQEVHREAGVLPAALVGSSEILAWGKGGIRSNTRYGSGSGGNGKHSRSRLSRLNEHLRNLDNNDNEVIEFMWYYHYRRQSFIFVNHFLSNWTLIVRQIILIYLVRAREL